MKWIGIVFYINQYFISLLNLYIIFLFYSMTEGAQQALRRIMELYSNTTRFALACNNSSQVIEPIQRFILIIIIIY